MSDYIKGRELEPVRYVQADNPKWSWSVKAKGQPYEEWANGMFSTREIAEADYARVLDAYAKDEEQAARTIPMAIDWRTHKHVLVPWEEDDLCRACRGAPDDPIHAVAAVHTVDLVFDGPPGPEGPRFIEAERKDGTSISVGQWIESPGTNGWWRLRLTVAR